MFPMNIDGGSIYFKDIVRKDLPGILKWYNKTDEFKYATGVDSPIDLERLSLKFLESAISSKEFFVGIYLHSPDEMIGILKGNVRHEEKNAAWISSIVIDKAYQRKGYGQEAYTIAESYLREKFNINRFVIAVIEHNSTGLKFWIKQGFVPLRRIQDHYAFKDSKESVIIMEKIKFDK